MDKDYSFKLTLTEMKFVEKIMADMFKVQGTVKPIAAIRRAIRSEAARIQK